MNKIGICLILFFPLHTLAADTPTQLGIAAWSHPVYDGSDSQQVMAIPVISYYGDYLFARTTQGVLEAGTRAELFKGFNVGMQLAYEGGRDSNASAFLTSHNIASIAPNLSLGVQTELATEIGPMPIWLLLRGRQNVDAAYGAQADFRLTAGIYGGERLSAGLFAQVTWADSNSMQSYYGITSQQSTSTGLTAFAADQGRLFNTEGVLWSFDLAKSWMLLGSLEARQLQGNVRNSPLVSVNSNYYASLGVGYQF